MITPQAQKKGKGKRAYVRVWPWKSSQRRMQVSCSPESRLRWWYPRMSIAASHASAKVRWLGISCCSSTAVSRTYVGPASAIGARGKLTAGTPCSRAGGGLVFKRMSEITGGWIMDCGLWTADVLEEMYEAHIMCENLDNGRVRCRW